MAFILRLIIPLNSHQSNLIVTSSAKDIEGPGIEDPTVNLAKRVVNMDRVIRVGFALLRILCYNSQCLLASQLQTAPG